jgi:hypothetical protein
VTRRQLGGRPARAARATLAVLARQGDGHAHAVAQAERGARRRVRDLDAVAPRRRDRPADGRGRVQVARVAHILEAHQRRAAEPNGAPGRTPSTRTAPPASA